MCICRELHNKHVDVSIIHKTLRGTTVDLIYAAITDEQDWRVPIFQNLTLPSLTMVAKDLKDFKMVNGQWRYSSSLIYAMEELQGTIIFHAKIMA